MSQTIALPSVLTADAVAQAQVQLLQKVQAAAQHGAVLVLDASAVQSFDSAGLALLLACRRSASAKGAQVQVQAWPSGMQSLANVYGVWPLLAPELMGATDAPESL